MILWLKTLNDYRPDNFVIDYFTTILIGTLCGSFPLFQMIYQISTLKEVYLYIHFFTFLRYIIPKWDKTEGDFFFSQIDHLRIVKIQYP